MIQPELKELILMNNYERLSKKDILLIYKDETTLIKTETFYDYDTLEKEMIKIAKNDNLVIFTVVDLQGMFTGQICAEDVLEGYFT